MNTSPSVQQQIDKRLILNLLIQGAAAHTFISAHHLAKEEIEGLSPGLVGLYDRFSIAGQLNYCIGDSALLLGWPNLFWGYAPIPQQPFRHSRFLRANTNRLATEETKHLKELAKKKGVNTRRFFHLVELMRLMNAVLEAESDCQYRLTKIAKRVAAEMWDIPEDRLDGTITRDVAFGNLRTPRTRLGRLTRHAAIGYGGVERKGKRFTVVAKAIVLPLLIHELVKGIMELICLHGLNALSDEVYRAVTEEADQLEYEAWLLQAGPAMWRRFLAVAPRESTLSTTVMALARLDPQPLDELMLNVIEKPQQATRKLQTAIAEFG